MNYKLLLLTIFFIKQNLGAQVQFDDFFSTGRLRYDYVAAGNNSSLSIYQHQLYKEPLWGGSCTNLIDSFRYGDMMLEVYDSLTGILIYSRGYSTLFKEWQTTDEAKSIERAYLESVIMPFPRKTVLINISERDRSQNFRKVHTFCLNPASDQIIHLNQPATAEVKIIESSGSSVTRTDIVFVAEGYTGKEKKKFYEDAIRFKKYFLSWAPYSSYLKAFNIYAVFSPSDESGTDNPVNQRWVNTALESGLNTFGSERYLTVSDESRLRNMVSGVPYDQICVLVNSDIYGGGGIYNFFTVFTADNKYSEFLFHHEFGHAFASLADEYYTSEVTYTEMFDTVFEPYQPNITTRVNFSAKWERMIPDTIPLPTPDSAYYKDVVGLFEGAAYCAKGIYRPYTDCSMKSKLNNAFCPVCRDAIIKMILFNGYTETK
jgi:hypothetical protein